MPESSVPRVPSPKGTVRLHPAEEREDGPPFIGVSLGDALEEKRMNDKQKRVALALRLAYHVTKTQQEFMTNDKKSDDQLWSVMPDVPSSSSKYKPVSKHKSRDDAVRALKNLEKKDLTEKMQQKEQDTEVSDETDNRLDSLVEHGELQRPNKDNVEPVVRAAPPKGQAETGDDFKAPPEKTEPVIRAKPPEGMSPEEQAEDQPKRRGEKTASTKRRWHKLQDAAKAAWSRR